METIKNIVGLGGKPEETSTAEPVNGEIGAGTATEPFDGGNKAENPPASTSSDTEPVNGVTGQGTATEPYDAGNKEENPPATSTKPEPLTEPLQLTEPKEGTAPVSDAVAGTTTGATATESKAVVTEPGTADAKEIEAKPAAHVEDATAATPSKPIPGASPLAAAAVADGTIETATESKEPMKETIVPPTAASHSEPAPTAAAEEKAPASTPAPVAEKSEKKEPKIGSVGWFKDTVSRRKSKTPTPEKTVEKPKEEKPLKDKVVAAVVPEKKAEPEPAKVAPAPAPVAEPEPVKATPAPVPVAEPAPVEMEEKEKKPLNEKIVAAVVPEKKEEEKKVQEPKPKKERSMSRDFKLFKSNPFKRDSKAGLGQKEEKKEAKDKKLGEAAAVGATAGAGTAIIAEEESRKKEPVTEPAAPNHISSDVPAGAAEPAKAEDLPPLQDSKTLEEPSTLTAAPVAEPVAEPVKTEPATESVVSEPVAAPSVTAEAPTEPTSEIAAASTEPVASAAIEPLAPQSKVEEDIAPDEVAPGVTAPAIIEPPTTSEAIPIDKGKIPERAPRNPQGENLSAIPTAGGVRLGEAAYTRRTSVAPPQPKETVLDKALPPAPLQAAKVHDSSLANDKTEAKTEAKTEEKKDGVPQRRLSVFDKLKSKLHV